MAERPLTQSSPRRAWEDTIGSFHKIQFFWGVEVVATAAFIFLGTILTPEDASRQVSAIYPTVGGVIGAIVGFGIIYLIYLLKAPIKQRNEARKLVEQQRTPTKSEVNDVIRLLDTEKLISKNNEGEERSFSFAQVFLLIADQLSIGISLIQFEEKIKKGLGIDERGGWYFPHENEGITHLIGMLTQNGLIDRHSEAYERMVRDYPADIDESMLEIAGTRNILRLKPPQHISKGTEVKYYLSPLGSRVIQQLRLQSTPDKGDSQTE